MPIPLSCACGRSLRIKDELAGRKVKCPECRTVLAVPAPEVPPEDEAADMLLADDPEGEARPRTKNYQPDPDEMVQTAPRPSRLAPGDDDDGERSRREARRREEEREERRRKERRREEERREERRREKPRVTFGSGWFGSTNGGVIGGLIMIVIAVVWFGLGFMAGRIFFYPPILAVLGIASIIKGLTSR